jgi:hypothetical protein
MSNFPVNTLLENRARHGSVVVVHLPHHPKVQGLILAAFDSIVTEKITINTLSMGNQRLYF